MITTQARTQAPARPMRARASTSWNRAPLASSANEGVDLFDSPSGRTALRDFSVYHNWVAVRAGRWEVATHLRDRNQDEPGSGTVEETLSDWLGWPVGEVARRLLASDSPTLRSVGMACLKASWSPFDEGLPCTAFELLGKHVASKPTCVVGVFPEALAWKARGFPVAILPVDGDWTPFRRILLQSEVVVASGLLIASGRHVELVERTPAARARVLNGPNVPSFPGLVQDGFHGISTTGVGDPGAANEYLRRGGASLRNAPEGCFLERTWIAKGGWLDEIAHGAPSARKAS